MENLYERFLRTGNIGDSEVGESFGGFREGDDMSNLRNIFAQSERIGGGQRVVDWRGESSLIGEPNPGAAVGQLPAVRPRQRITQDVATSQPASDPDPTTGQLVEQIGGTGVAARQVARRVGNYTRQGTNYKVESKKGTETESQDAPEKDLTEDLPEEKIKDPYSNYLSKNDPDWRPPPPRRPGMPEAPQSEIEARQNFRDPITGLTEDEASELFKKPEERQPEPEAQTQAEPESQPETISDPEGEARLSRLAQQAEDTPNILPENVPKGSIPDSVKNINTAEPEADSIAEEASKGVEKTVADTALKEGVEDTVTEATTSTLAAVGAAASSVASFATGLGEAAMLGYGLYEIGKELFGKKDKPPSPVKPPPPPKINLPDSPGQMLGTAIGGMTRDVGLR